MRLHTPEPFWLIKNGLINSYPSLDSDISCEVLVIGSGITGALISHQCMLDGYKTVVLDRREVAHGSSSATTSMLQYEIDTPLWELLEMIGEEGAVKSYQACSDAIDDIEKTVKAIRSKCGFKRKKSLYYADKKSHISDLKKEFQARKQHGFKVKWLEAAEIEKKYGIKNTYGGILSNQGASLDAFKLAHDLLEYNHRQGMKVFDKTEVANIHYSPKQVTVTTEDGFTIKARHLIFCTGFETVNVIPENFVKLISTYAITGEQQPGEYKRLEKTLFWNTSDPYNYFRTTDDGRLLIGGGDDDFANPEKRDSAISRKTANLEKYIKKNMPDLTFRTDFAWAGTFGTTKDGLPYIGKHKDFPGAYFVLGFGGNGITFSAAGMHMVSAYLKGKKHELEQWFRFGR